MGGVASHMNTYRLGEIEWIERRDSIAFKLWRMSAAAGCDDSMRRLIRGVARGHVTPDEWMAAYRFHKKAKNEMRSEEREKYAARSKAD